MDKSARTRVFISEDEYRNFLNQKSCEELKQMSLESLHVPGEKKLIYDQVVESKCKNASVKSAINTLISLADNLDKSGLDKEAQIVDVALQKFAKLLNCKNC